MPYDHSTKIGNQGDLVKHIALFAALHQLLDKWPRSDEFVYADIHAGRPQYVLPENGEWKHGIGAFSKIDSVTADRKERKKSHSTLGSLGGFDDFFVGRRLTTGMTYPGSSAIVFRVLRNTGIRFRMKLWEEDRAAADELIRYFLPWKELVTVVWGNGYDVIKESGPLNLALIDPPKLESDQVRETMVWLNTRETAFICWTPRSSRPSDPPAEAETSRMYVEQARQHGACFRLKWYNWGHRTPGCCITVSPNISQSVGEALERVTTIMRKDWELAGNGTT